MATEKRLIDANALSEKIGNMKFEITHNRGGYRYCYEDEKSEWDKLDGFDSLVCDAPTVDAVEVVHGEWEKYTDDKFIGYGADGRIRYRKVYSYKCSKCWNYTAVKHNYCPNCGAKMDGERRTNERKAD